MAKRRLISSQPHDLIIFPPPDSAAGQLYFYVTQRPWPSLVFILPMLLIFEIGTYMRTGGTARGGSQLVASYLIEWLVTSMRSESDASHLLAMAPGLLLVAILLTWHVAARHPWRFDLSVLPGMLGESLIWTIPLFAFGGLLQQQALLAGDPAARAEWIDKVIRSFGAGIYEELVFRLICITLLVILLIDIARLPRAFAAGVIIAASALLFAAQHHPPLGAEPFNIVRFSFRTGAGLYLAGLFVFRGFGIAAGCHAFYNVLLVTASALLR